MEVIMAIVALIGMVASGYDFPTLYFYISLSNAIWKILKHYAKDKTARR